MISVIIPVFNEEKVLKESLSEIKERSGSYLREIIVVDGGSSDSTVEIARACGVRVLECPGKGRARQMNFGASHAGSELLYFLHADSIPPENFDQLIRESEQRGAGAGCFRLEFDEEHPVLKSYAWFTRFDVDLFRYGDQSLFVKKEIFQKVEGFDESLMVMEDQDIVRRLKKCAEFEILNQSTKTSARRYLKVGIFRLQLIFALIVLLYYMGAGQDVLTSFYRKMME